MFADDTAIWCSQRSSEKATSIVQKELHRIEKWTNHWPHLKKRETEQTYFIKSEADFAAAPPKHSCIHIIHSFDR
ncbi:hypothetical protein MTP99_018754 [Tenebrio molitor]|nr:hypothetical protein MTP99_018754 [Tenebrio molitor]